MARNFAGQNRQKPEKRTRFSQKKANSGAFWVLEGMGTVENGSNQMRKPGKLGENQGTDLISAAASGAAPQWGAPSTDRSGSRDRRSRAPLALAHPSARGFGVDVGKHARERGKGSVARFSQTSPETAVLIWCCEEILRDKDGKNKFFLRTVVLSNPQ